MELSQEHKTLDQSYQSYEVSTEQVIQTQDANEGKQEFVELIIDANRKEYGNLIVLMQKPFLITLGPDCTYQFYIDGCFIAGFSFFIILGYFLCYLVSSTFQNPWIVYGTYFSTVLQCGSYLSVALSNPSISLKSNNPISLQKVTKQNQHLICHRCGAESRRRTYHCRDCDVCVIGYDHHCPWTSKCIGSGNLYRFYLFVTITPIYILLFMALMFGCLIVNAQKANQNLKQHTSTY